MLVQRNTDGVSHQSEAQPPSIPDTPHAAKIDCIDQKTGPVAHPATTGWGPAFLSPPLAYPKINTTLMVITNSSPLIDETIAFYRMRIERGQKSAQRLAFQGEKDPKKSIALYYKIAKNIKNNKANPFPGNCKRAMLVQRKIAVFEARIGRHFTSVLIFSYAESVFVWCGQRRARSRSPRQFEVRKIRKAR